MPDISRAAVRLSARKSLHYAVLHSCCCLQCARATHSSLPTASLTATALHSLAVCVAPLVTLGMLARPLPPASQMGPTVM
jgi:hypothetical protein